MSHKISKQKSQLRDIFSNSFHEASDIGQTIRLKLDVALLSQY